MAQYNGHRSWNAWNVALWIGNDEPLYRLAVECKRRSKTLGGGARLFIEGLGDGAKTPDGAKYNLTCVKEAMRDL